MTRFSTAAALAGCLAAAAASAQSPGPTDPAGPTLEPAGSPRTGTEIREPAMDEEIERGTLIDRKDVLEDESDPPIAPSPEVSPAEPNRRLHSR